MLQICPCSIYIRLVDSGTCKIWARDGDREVNIVGEPVFGVSTPYPYIRDDCIYWPNETPNQQPNTVFAPLDTMFYTKYNKAYQVFLSATDVLGNTTSTLLHPNGRRFLNVVKKTLSNPCLRAVRWFSPLISINADCDTYRVWGSDITKPFRKDTLNIPNNGSLWRIEQDPLPVLAEPGTPQTITLNAEDIAGNRTSVACVTRLYSDGCFAGNFEDYGRTRPMNNDNLWVQPTTTDEDDQIIPDGSPYLLNIPPSPSPTVRHLLRHLGRTVGSGFVLCRWQGNTSAERGGQLRRSYILLLAGDTDGA